MDGFGGRIEVDGCDTIPKLFWHQVKARDERTAFREKTLGIWRATSWRDYGERARAVGMGLVKLGLKRGDVVSVLADTLPEWLYADMGTMGVGGVTNGIYPTDSAKQVDYILNDSRSRFLFVENEEQLDKFLEVRERCPSLTKVFVFDMEGLADFKDPMVMPFSELMTLGLEYDKASPGEWEKRVGASKAEELALLVYTSGTTGAPKGAMISHRNVIFQLCNADAFIPLGTDDEQLAFLPLCHIAERTFTSFLPLRSGAIANFAESVETVPENIREVAPTTFFAVPRIWERFYSSIAIRMKEATWIGRTAYKWALGIGLKVAETELEGRQPSAMLKLAHAIADYLVLDNIKRAIGMHRIRFAGTGAAPIAPDRMKDIIITAGGKNITPSEIENQLKFSPYISDAVVIGDKRKFLSCLIMIDYDNVAKHAQDANVPFTDFGSLCRAREISDLIWAEIERVNAGFARVETIKKFRLIEQQLTAEDDEVTPTMKLKRKFVSEKYKPMIDGMYAEAS